MKTKFIILSMTGILLISACNKSIIEEGLSGPSLFFGDASEESMLVFSNGEELREQILHPEKALPTTRCNNPKESFQVWAGRSVRRSGFCRRFHLGNQRLGR